MVSFWTVASPPHEFNSDVLGTSLALHSHIYDRQELFSMVFWDSKESHDKEGPSAYFVFMWQYPSVCHDFMTLPMKTTYALSVCFQPSPALLISSTTPFSEAPVQFQDV